MKFLIREKLSPHKSKTPEGYLICTDAILARTGKQDYYEHELWPDRETNNLIAVDRKPEQVFAPETIASFENKPLCIEHPDEDVTPDNYRDLAVGFVRDVHQGKFEGQDVLIGNLVITDADAINDVESGVRPELSCGYNCDITEGENPEQINIRGNHVALCGQGRAGIAKIIDTKPLMKDAPIYLYTKFKEAGNNRDKLIDLLETLPGGFMMWIKNNGNWARYRKIKMRWYNPQRTKRIAEFTKEYSQDGNYPEKVWNIDELIMKNEDFSLTAPKLTNQAKDANLSVWTVGWGYMDANGEPYTATAVVHAESPEQAKTIVKENHEKAAWFDKPKKGRLMWEAEELWPWSKEWNAAAEEDKLDYDPATGEVFDDAPKKKLSRANRNKISDYLAAVSGFVHTNVDIYNLIRRMEAALTIDGEPLSLTRESIDGWKKMSDGMYRKDYIFSVDGFDNHILISLYAKGNGDWDTTEINGYMTDSIYGDISDEDIMAEANGQTIPSYKGYDLCYEDECYKVNFDGKPAMFATEDEAKSFIDEAIERTTNMIRDKKLRDAAYSSEFKEELNKTILGLLKKMHNTDDDLPDNHGKVEYKRAQLRQKELLKKMVYNGDV